MYSAQLQIYAILAVLRRRWMAIMIPLMLVTGVCVVGVFFLPQRFESSTTIMVRPDQTLGPLSGYDRTILFEEQLRNFNEIIFSRTTLQRLADSLGIHQPSTSEVEKLQQISVLKEGISTSRLSPDIFSIGFTDANPKKAKRGAEVLATIFIGTKVDVENRQNALAVEFYEGKLAKYGEELGNRVQSIVSVLKERVDELPFESRSLYEKMNDTEKELARLDSRLRILREALPGIDRIIALAATDETVLRQERGRDQLIKIQRLDLPSISSLNELLQRYEELSQKYTPSHPEIVKLKSQIVEQLRTIRVDLGLTITEAKSRKSELENRRMTIVEELKKSSTATKMSREEESRYEISRKLYDEMVLKLEQAKLAAEVANRGVNQYIILDPAYEPVRPSKPNKIPIVAGGFAAGLALGFLFAFIREILDTTIRHPRDIEIYRRPIVALLPDAEHDA